uniref:Uncharacterized protein n=1 Tax=Romanomermis culicivorax TaxID=13658 RepID=A0A915KA03_ROMCU
MAKTLQTCQKNHPRKFCASNNLQHKIEYFNSSGLPGQKNFNYTNVHKEINMPDLISKALNHDDPDPPPQLFSYKEQEELG